MNRQPRFYCSLSALRVDPQPGRVCAICANRAPRPEFVFARALSGAHLVLRSQDLSPSLHRDRLAVVDPFRNMTTTRRFCLLLLLASSLCPTPALHAQDTKSKFTRTEDVIYGRKFGTALTLDVFEPPNKNGAA